jgi:hypothetical protein
MRRPHTAALAALVFMSTLPALVWAQSSTSPVMQQGYGAAPNGTTAAAPRLPRTLARAAALIAMARSAPAAAPTFAVTRQTAIAVQAAAAAYQTALADFTAGYYGPADTAARRAARLATLAIATVLTQSSDITETSSAGDVSPAAPSTTPVALVSTAGTGSPVGRPRSYADITPLPFGAVLPGPPAPPLRDSLPFGVIPVP